MMAECVRLNRDCAEICWLAAGLMSRGSRFAGVICELCAEVCEACGRECGKHKHDHCQQCADACRNCAKVTVHGASVLVFKGLVSRL